ncbi:alpha/beta-type small acid-soluble spore protein [Sediminibacillus halophilus]|uniref:Small, acid-soluble spore protein, alpha/beta type n=1 Tax=Sediminibacillus halophilus TaxID=482461 RepID=A0A1G9R1C2_9BACI|nr:alpha/beta-type small acid-soluble spore protein [Sediminibacillus halophilus]SDM17086.1 Small, acid-soluble spore protein, alpha/beta type [Sediminibacillus halophilus]
MARRNKILVPGAREGLDKLKAKVSKSQTPENAKYETAEEQGIDLKHGYNGDMKAKDAGKIGGKIGGSMVKEMIEMAEKQMKNKQ